MKSRIFIVDDHPIMRRGYRSIINLEPDMEVCGEAGSVAEALELIPESNPDLVIVDISLQDMNGIELIKRLEVEQSGVSTLVISMHDESLYAERALHAGARGYIMKSEVDSTVIAAIRKVMHGGFYLSDSMSARVLRQITGRQPVANNPLERLSDRELETFELIGRGHSTRQIARSMHISPKTVESHRRRIKEKLNIESTGELRRRAVLWVYGEEKADQGTSQEEE